MTPEAVRKVAAIQSILTEFLSSRKRFHFLFILRPLHAHHLPFSNNHRPPLVALLLLLLLRVVAVEFRTLFTAGGTVATMN